jgi:hypothetical protein
MQAGGGESMDVVCDGVGLASQILPPVRRNCDLKEE